MRKPIAIFFIVVFTLSTSLGELLKFPLLLNHFKTHITLDKSVSFYSFLYEHYVTHPNNNDDDQKQDKQLPFRSFHAEQLNFICLLTYPSTSIELPYKSKEKMPLPLSCFHCQIA